jgi:hypothetical protein
MVTEKPRFEIGRVATMTFGVVRGNFLIFLVLGIIATLPNAFFSVATTTGAVNVRGATASFFVATFAAVFVGALFTFVLQAVITQGTINHLNRQPASLGRLLMVGLREILPLFAIGILESLGIGLGFILLIVPGIMLFVMWSVIVPIRVVEHRGIFESFSRSAELTAGYRWPIFGTMLVYYIGAGIAQFSVRPAVGVAISSGMTWTYVGIGTLVNAVVAVVAATGIACIYYELRMIKEGVGPEQIASVFS